MTVRQVVQVRLLPTPEQVAALEATLRACNQAANHVSQAGYIDGETGVFALRRASYAQIKSEFGLGAQVAQHVIKKVADAYVTLKASIRAGILGPATSKRRIKAEGKAIAFRPEAAQPFDDRCLSWQHDAGTVSIWTVAGRMKNVRFAGEPGQLKVLRERRRGESDLYYRDGKWFLAATVEVEEAELNWDPVGWIGVDRGIVNLATTSDGINYCGNELTAYRRRQARVRAELQAKNTKSAKRLLKKRSRKEARHCAQVNHKISKEIVAVAARTGRGIALEDLSGIRERVRLSRDQRATLNSWNFHQQGTFTGYKARRAGVPVIEVDAAYTSQTCPNPWCGQVSKKNRPTRDAFHCRSCGLAGPADHVAALNVERRAGVAWAFVNAPHAAGLPSPRHGLLRAASPRPSRTGRHAPTASTAGS